jgi:hypothetical protein
MWLNLRGNKQKEFEVLDSDFLLILQNSGTSY